MVLWWYQYTIWDCHCYMTCNVIDLDYSSGTAILRNMACLSVEAFPFHFPNTCGCTVSEAATIHLNCNETKVAKCSFHLLPRYTGGTWNVSPPGNRSPRELGTGSTTDYPGTSTGQFCWQLLPFPSGSETIWVRISSTLRWSQVKTPRSADALVCSRGCSGITSLSQAGIPCFYLYGFMVALIVWQQPRIKHCCWNFQITEA